MNDEMNPEVTTVRALAFEEVDRDWTEQLLMKRGGPRYGAAIEALLGGKSLFVAGMGKVELESLRASLPQRGQRVMDGFPALFSIPLLLMLPFKMTFFICGLQPPDGAG